MFKRHKHQHISLQSRVVGVWEQRKKKIFKRTFCYCGSCLKNLEMQMMIVMQKDMCVCVCLYPKIKRLLYTHGYTIYICFCTVLSTISHVLVLIASPVPVVSILLRMHHHPYVYSSKDHIIIGGNQEYAQKPLSGSHP